MKRTILLLMMIGIISITAFSQISRPEVIKKKIEPAQPKTTQPPPSTPAPVYTLTAARVTIRTGNDNKEFPSQADVQIWVPNIGYALEQPGANMRNEMKINSVTEFGLQNNSTFPQQAKLLSSFQKDGFWLVIKYWPNFFMDAWKIEGVSVVLEFRDQNSNLHPTLGSKTIVFNNASGLLTGTDYVLRCTADASFNPLTSSVRSN